MNPKELAKWLDGPKLSERITDTIDENKNHKCGGERKLRMVTIDKAVAVYQQIYDVEHERFVGKVDFPLELNDEDHKGVLELTCSDCGETLGQWDCEDDDL